MLLPAQFQCKCSDFGLEDAAIEALFITLDTNSDGQISLEEFTGGWAKFQEAQQGGGGGGGAEEVPFAGLNDAINASFAQGKAVLICDPTGKSSSFLQYNATVMDCKGLFVLDKIHGKVRPPHANPDWVLVLWPGRDGSVEHGALGLQSPEDIAEEARAKLVATMKGGQWLQLEMGKAAPAIGEISSEEGFPGAQLLLPNFGKNEELFAKFVKEEEKESGIFVPKGDW